MRNLKINDNSGHYVLPATPQGQRTHFTWANFGMEGCLEQLGSEDIICSLGLHYLDMASVSE